MAWNLKNDISQTSNLSVGMCDKIHRTDGFLEGMSRSISQAAVFLIDTQKTRKQLYAGNTSAPPIHWGQLLKNGMLTSVTTSGIVFGCYYSVYNTIGSNHWYAGPSAALLTSSIKIPISNCIRLMQSGLAANPFSAAKQIVRQKRIQGLYTGYSMSLLEDMIELDLRTRMYNTLRPYLIETEDPMLKSAIGGSLGSVVGSSIAWITNPFDCIRSHMAISRTKENGLQVAHRILQQRGIQGLYSGAMLRASSSALKSGLFFLCIESLQI
jgi:hypothetical protein